MDLNNILIELRQKKSSSVFNNGDFKVDVVEIIKGRTSVWGELIDGNK